MAKLFAIYRQPDDPAAFDRHEGTAGPAQPRSHARRPDGCDIANFAMAGVAEMMAEMARL